MAIKSKEECLEGLRMCSMGDDKVRSHGFIYNIDTFVIDKENEFDLNLFRITYLL